MASGTKLQIRYKDQSGSVFSHSWKYGNPSVSANKVSALVTATIANGTIFNKVPVEFKDAKIVTTAETDINVNVNELTAKGIKVSPPEEFATPEDEIENEITLEQERLENIEAMRVLLHSEAFKALREEAEKADINPESLEITE